MMEERRVLSYYPIDDSCRPAHDADATMFMDLLPSVVYTISTVGQRNVHGAGWPPSSQILTSPLLSRVASQSIKQLVHVSLRHRACGVETCSAPVPTDPAGPLEIPLTPKVRHLQSASDGDERCHPIGFPMGITGWLSGVIFLGDRYSPSYSSPISDSARFAQL